MATINQALILFPMAVLVAQVMVMAPLMLRERVQEMKARRIHPQKVATSTQMAGVLHNTRAADNYRNLFEAPGLFYVALVAAFASVQVSPLIMGLAWTYVALRYLHSYIHCTNNRIRHRLYAFLASNIVLWAMWIVLVVGVLRTA